VQMEAKLVAADVFCPLTEYEKIVEPKKVVFSAYMPSGCPYLVKGYTLEMVGILGLAAATAILAIVAFFGTQKVLIQGGLVLAIGLCATVGGILILVSASASKDNLANAIKAKNSHFYPAEKKPNDALYKKVEPILAPCHADAIVKAEAALALLTTGDQKVLQHAKAVVDKLEVDCKLAAIVAMHADRDKYEKWGKDNGNKDDNNNDGNKQDGNGNEGHARALLQGRVEGDGGGGVKPKADAHGLPNLAGASEIDFETTFTTFRDLSQFKDKSDAGVIGLVVGILFLVLGGHMIFTAIRSSRKDSNVAPAPDANQQADQSVYDDTQADGGATPQVDTRLSA